MKLCLALLCFIFTITFQSVSYANWLADIVNRIEIGNIINTNILDSQTASLNVQRDILTSQRDVQKLMEQVNSNMTGHSGWGTYHTHDYQSYGDNARNWSDVIQLASSGNRSGALGQTMNSLANQFPTSKDVYNKGVSDPTSQTYYRVRSETVLATRAASQLDYDKIQDQISYQQMLQQEIEHTKDLKGAVDLNNRIQVEANLINLEVLRQSALANQQHAIGDQANVNSALQNAKFLSK
jgi:hypothetical protein